MAETMESLHERCTVAGCENPAVARFDVPADAALRGTVPATTWQPGERVPLCEDHAVQFGEGGLGRPVP